MPKYWLRPFTTRMNKQRLLSLLEHVAPGLLQLSRAVNRIPHVGRMLKRFVPVANYEGIYPLTEKQLVEWAILDTFDWLSPTYDKPQTTATLTRWMNLSKMRNVEVLKAGHLVARGSKE